MAGRRCRQIVILFRFSSSVSLRMKRKDENVTEKEWDKIDGCIVKHVQDQMADSRLVYPVTKEPQDSLTDTCPSPISSHKAAFPESS